MRCRTRHWRSAMGVMCGAAIAFSFRWTRGLFESGSSSTYVQGLSNVAFESLILHRASFNGSTESDDGITDGTTSTDGARDPGEPAQYELSFADAMRRVPWDELLRASRAKNRREAKKLTQAFLDALFPFLIREPPVAVNRTCRPPPLPPPDAINCSVGHSYAFKKTGRRIKAAKVAHIVQMGPDVDVLWILLEELYDVVDHIFLLESTRTHNLGLRKALFWEHVRHQHRFRKFTDKVVHIVMDDIDSTTPRHGGGGSGFALEVKQEAVRWQSFLRWNRQTGGYFTDDDLVGFGDVDEIPSRHAIHRMKWCELAGPSVDVASWFAPGDVRRAFRSDFPVPGRPWSLGDPTYFTMRSATKAKNPTRMRGKSRRYVLGGAHLSDNPYLPFIMTKLLVCSDCNGLNVDVIQMLHRYLKHATPSSIRELEQHPKRMADMQGRMAMVEDIKDTPMLRDIYHLPWFYKCNQRMFPAWRGMHDRRLD